MQKNLSLKELQDAVDAGKCDTVLVCLVDMQGRLIGKRFHGEHFAHSAYEETHGCDYLLANDLEMEPVPGYRTSNWEKGYGDFVMKPDLETLCWTPWLEKTTLVLCDVLDHHGDPVSHSPRAILKKQIDHMKTQKMTALAATELEFYLFDEGYRQAWEKNYHNLQTAGYYIQDYNILQTSKEEPFMRQVRNDMHEAGIIIENSKGEWGPGQEEINIRYGDVLKMADQHSILKNGIKEIAHLQNKSVTFMSKWHSELAGSSSHIHISLWDEAVKTPLFLDSSQKYGMSTLMQHFLAGQLTYAKEITYFLAPYVNSYKRFRESTFAPTRSVWSVDNRTTGFRICSENSKAIRVECRIGGADLNPYLGLAALLAIGRKGVEDKLPLEDEFQGDAYQRDDIPHIPSSLEEATALMDKSDILRGLFGDDVIDHYSHTARWEKQEHGRQVSDWEKKRGFERA